MPIQKIPPQDLPSLLLSLCALPHSIDMITESGVIQKAYRKYAKDNSTQNNQAHENTQSTQHPNHNGMLRRVIQWVHSQAQPQNKPRNAQPTRTDRINSRSGGDTARRTEPDNFPWDDISLINDEQNFGAPARRPPSPHNPVIPAPTSTSDRSRGSGVSSTFTVIDNQALSSGTETRNEHTSEETVIDAPISIGGSRRSDVSSAFSEIGSQAPHSGTENRNEHTSQDPAKRPPSPLDSITDGTLICSNRSRRPSVLPGIRTNQSPPEAVSRWINRAHRSRHEGGDREYETSQAAHCRLNETTSDCNTSHARGDPAPTESSIPIELPLWSKSKPQKAPNYKLFFKGTGLFLLSFSSFLMTLTKK